MKAFKFKLLPIFSNGSSIIKFATNYTTFNQILFYEKDVVNFNNNKKNTSNTKVNIFSTYKKLNN